MYRKINIYGLIFIFVFTVLVFSAQPLNASSNVNKTDKNLEMGMGNIENAVCDGGFLKDGKCVVSNASRLLTQEEEVHVMRIIFAVFIFLLLLIVFATRYMIVKMEKQLSVFGKFKKGLLIVLLVASVSVLLFFFTMAILVPWQG